MIVEKPYNCPDCGVPPGRTHRDFCDVERCSVCGLQHLGCECAGHNPKLTFWTGYWPGDETCRMFGIDQNELALMVWNQRTGARR